MYNTSTEGVYVQGSNVVARIDHCTFNNLGYSRNEYTRLRYVVDAEITNCIYSKGVVPPSRCMLFYGSLLSNCNFYEVGSVSMSNSEYTTQESIWKDYDPVYEDADNGNFTLLESSPMYFKATDGEALGDLRWAKNEPETPYYTVSIKVLSEIDSISIEGATVVFNNETMITDASGPAVFDSISPITNAAYVVTADNFQDASGSITVTNDNITETALMSPEAYTVTFIVSGNDGFIEGALVVFNNAIILTDVEGKAVFDSIAPISDAMYLVTAENYQNTSGSITVNDADVTETVLLTSLFSSQFENWNEEVIIYPNPASEYIKLRLPDGFIGTVEFIDITGRIMEILDVSNEKNILFNTEAFNEGIYYVKVSSENTTITKRFIISK